MHTKNENKKKLAPRSGPPRRAVAPRSGPSGERPGGRVAHTRDGKYHVTVRVGEAKGGWKRARGRRAAPKPAPALVWTRIGWRGRQRQKRARDGCFGVVALSASGVTTRIPRLQVPIATRSHLRRNHPTAGYALEFRPRSKRKKKGGEIVCLREEANPATH
ncbi:hypothetical protein C8R44DRAFT_751933 [Mycena epipterygia]|nr:hypothetical protein C8R44DRAFT_751933 [Mycena epipterygia]